MIEALTTDAELPGIIVKAIITANDSQNAVFLLTKKTSPANKALAIIIMLYPEIAKIWVVPVLFNASLKSAGRFCLDPRRMPFIYAALGSATERFMALSKRDFM